MKKTDSVLLQDLISNIQAREKTKANASLCSTEEQVLVDKIENVVARN